MLSVAPEDVAAISFRLCSEEKTETEASPLDDCCE